MATITETALSDVTVRLEGESPATIIRWAVDTFPALCLTSSMSDALLIDLAVAVEPSIEVVFIDTGYHFAETLALVDLVRTRYRINLRVMHAAAEESDLSTKLEPGGCCSAAKGRQLDLALAGRDAWLSGVRRSDSPTRAGTSIVARDHRGLVKVNPIAAWSDGDVQRYIDEHDVPVHPLIALGYPSIGCWPCTTAVPLGGGPRGGRWAGSDRSECGLHA